MATDWYFYNATNKYFDLSASIDDVLRHAAKIIPPGSQAHVVDPVQIANHIVVHTNYGAVTHASVVVPATFKGVSHNPTPIGINGKKIPIV
jgi:hypothetical protein